MKLIIGLLIGFIIGYYVCLYFIKPYPVFDQSKYDAYISQFITSDIKHITKNPRLKSKGN